MILNIVFILQEFNLADDYNRMSQTRDYLGKPVNNLPSVYFFLDFNLAGKILSIYSEHLLDCTLTLFLQLIKAG